MNIQKFTQKSVEAINNCERFPSTIEIRKFSRSPCYFPVSAGREALPPLLVEMVVIVLSISPRMRSANWMRASKYPAATAMSMSEKI